MRSRGESARGGSGISILAPERGTPGSELLLVDFPTGEALVENALGVVVRRPLRGRSLTRMGTPEQEHNDS
ncbi:hypothetical protein, partial [Arthrobacter sp. PsM3]|uniref:hypothetical protein n=1 Tax=Arthrobacter sp. PsM3 TaxID=3030531 RepID=UPI00263BDD9B